MRLPFDLVEVLWIDAAAQESGWQDHVAVKPAEVLSVGFLIYCKRDHIVIAQDVDEDGGHNGRTQIPRGMVKTMRVLKKKKV